MAGVITTGNHPKALWPGIHEWFGLSYAEHPEEWRQLFDVQNSAKNYEEDVMSPGFGLAPTKTEGGAVQYDSENQGYTKRYTHVVYGLGYITTQEEMEDNLYAIVGKRRSKRLAFSMRQTKEIVCANVYNRAFNSSYTGGDGKEWLATDHPSLAGTFQNELTTAADFSEAALEDMLILIGQAKNQRGLNIALRPTKMIIPVNLQFEVGRVLKSALRAGTADNDINLHKGMLDYTVNHYLTDTDAWFIRTDCPVGAQLFERRALAFTQDNDFDTENAKAKATMRFSVGWTDPLSLFGTPGA